MIATIQAWFQQLYETTGFNFTVFYDPYDWGRYVAGLRMTLLLGISTILASLVIGAVGALLQSGPSRVLRALVNGFVVVFRNTPPLVQIFFFYFGLGTLLPDLGSVFRRGRVDTKLSAQFLIHAGLLPRKVGTMLYVARGAPALTSSSNFGRSGAAMSSTRR